MMRAAGSPPMGLTIADYTFDDAIGAVLAPAADPLFWLSLAGLAVAVALLVLLTPKLKVDEKHLAAVEACRRETGHRCNRKPNAPLRRNIFQRFPGVWSEQVCRCRDRQRIRWLGGPNSARAVAFKNSQQS